MGAIIKIAGITTIYAKPHDFSHTLRNLSLKPMLIAMSVNEIMAVVTIPIIMAKAILFFIFFVLLFNKKKEGRANKFLNFPYWDR
jgi:hypothetical protein